MQAAGAGSVRMAGVAGPWLAGRGGLVVRGPWPGLPGRR